MPKYEGRGITMTRAEYRSLRAEYLRGDVDWLHVYHNLECAGWFPEEAAKTADRWKKRKRELNRGV